MNIPRELCPCLIKKGHSCRHVGDIGMSRADDPQIVKLAKKDNEVIITHDLDYGDILALSGERNPSVLIFRVKNTHPSHLMSLLDKYLEKLLESYEKGAITIIEDAGVRIRELPVLSHVPIH